ncbi:ATP-binding domain-containing protein [Endozoicomonas atrinae]|uniref:ATP-binding domain-containing protein n=1 Tax=Endozoicomonas atrinae TaxID=1333660 RepID=UPI001930F06B|nr:ATP-binding domain-containing protein [Endozoicomonas atrinae]
MGRSSLYACKVIGGSRVFVKYCVEIPTAMQHYTLLERNLLYTGVTRGKQMVVLVGQPKAVGMAARTRKSNRRLTNLQARLGGS